MLLAWSDSLPTLCPDPPIPTIAPVASRLHLYTSGLYTYPYLLCHCCNRPLHSVPTLDATQKLPLTSFHPRAPTALPGQPAFSVSGVASADAADRVCAGCASTCFMPNQIQATECPAGGFVCATQRLVGDDGYMFLPRLASEPPLEGTAKGQYMVTLEGEMARRDQQTLYASLFDAPMGLREKMQGMLGRLESSATTVRGYENSLLQAKALRTMPVQRLYELAMLQMPPMEVPDTQGGVFQRKVLDELMGWWKRDFFQWVDAPPCGVCQGATACVGMGQPNAEEQAGQAGRVEVYKCNACGAMTRFPVRFEWAGSTSRTMCIVFWKCSD